MKKNLSLTLAMLFVCVQLLALLHMAGYGFEGHEHNGETCGIYLSGEQSKYCAGAKPIFVVRLAFIQDFITFPPQTPAASQTFSPVSPRAPPVFLLS